MKSNNHGGPRKGTGPKRKPVSQKYQQISVKLPPDVLEWLAANTSNRNGFIVEAVKAAIAAHINAP